MDTQFKRLGFAGPLAAATWSRVKRAKWWGTIVAVIALWLVKLYMESEVTSVLHALAPYLHKLIHAEIGYAGLAILILVTVLFLLSWWESRPKARQRVHPSPAEIVAIEAVRSFYGNVGDFAASRVVGLFDLLRQAESIIGQWFAVALLDLKRDALKGSQKELALLTGQEAPHIKDIRGALASFYEHYAEAVYWMHNCEQVGVDLCEEPYVGLYEAWENDDRQLRDRVKDLITQPPLSSARGRIDRVGFRTAESERYRVAYQKAQQRLKNVTPDEAKFLDLYGIDARLPDPSDESSYLTHEIYSAGEGLAEDGLIVVRKNDDGTVRFGLKEVTVRAWFAGDAYNGSIGRRHVDVPLRAVLGRGLSGGGDIPSGSHT